MGFRWYLDGIAWFAAAFVIVCACGALVGLV